MTGSQRIPDPCATPTDNGRSVWVKNETITDPGTSVWVKNLKRKKVKKKRLPAINYGHTQCPDPGEDPSKADLRKPDPGRSVWVKHLKRKNGEKKGFRR